MLDILDFIHPGGTLMHCRRSFLTLLALLFGVAGVRAEEAPAWVDAMKKVRARFSGTPGTLALFGDSITVSMAFWSPLRGEPKNMSDEMAAALKVVKQHMLPDCWGRRGPKFGNNGSMTIRWADENVDKWL